MRQPRSRFTLLRRIRHLNALRAPRHYLSYLACRAALSGLRLLPRSIALRAGRTCGLTFYALSSRHRRIALDNLALAFGDRLSRHDRARLARASFAHAGMIIADAAHFARASRLPIERLAVYEGRDHLTRAAEGGRGVLVFSGHFGHWELVALLQARLGVPFSMVVRPLENRRLDAYLGDLRRVTGNELISKYHAARGVLRALHAGRAIALLIDQNVRGEGGLFVDFFGVPASTTPALATFALKSGAPIVPVFSSFLPDGRLLIRYGPPVPIVRRGSLPDDIRALTQECTRLLEEEIRHRPECWLWMHNRWRTRPAMAPAGGAATPDRAVAAARFLP